MLEDADNYARRGNDDPVLTICVPSGDDGLNGWRGAVVMDEGKVRETRSWEYGYGGVDDGRGEGGGES